MRIRTLAPAALLLSAAALLSACDGPASPGERTPSVSFRYSGSISGVYSVTAPRPAPGVWTPPLVQGITPLSNAFYINSAGLNGGAREYLTIQGPRTLGTYPMGVPCPVTESCPAISGVFIGVDSAGHPREGGREFIFTQGTMTILQPPRAGWIRGRFSGTAEVKLYTGGQWRADTPFTVTDGTFEADLIEGPYN
jgi:hypothetical protein